MNDSPRFPLLAESNVDFDLQLTLQRVDGPGVVQWVDLTTETDGTIKISSRGALPRPWYRQLGSFRQRLHEFARLTGRDVIIEHEGMRFASLRCHPSNTPKLSIHWWSILRHALRRPR